MKLLHVLCTLLISSFSYAHPTEAIEASAQRDITTLYSKPPIEMNKRIEDFSYNFINKPYLVNPLGEGINGQFSQKPLFRTDGFDCLTYVETILALAFANNTIQFNQLLQNIRYSGPINFINRNHFTGLDWNTNAENRGYIIDITKTIKNEKQQPVFLMAIAEIDKHSWYQHLPETRLYLPESPHSLEAERLEQLHQAGNHFKNESEKVPYLPLSVLFDPAGKPNLYIFNQIPNDSIIEIVRPNWDLTQQIGTHLNISHIGFAIRKGSEILFRDASSTTNKVSDRSLIEYLHQQMVESPTVKGINIHIVNSKRTPIK